MLGVSTLTIILKGLTMANVWSKFWSAEFESSIIESLSSGNDYREFWITWVSSNRKLVVHFWWYTR